jgi:hypothetical protein
MDLTEKGQEVLTYDQRDKVLLAQMLIRGELNINAFTKGICYDVSAFMKYLLSGNNEGGLGITDHQLLQTYSQQWIPKLVSPTLWKYRSFIAPGSILTFKRLKGSEVFHAAVSIGMTSVRSVNGLLLGANWRIPADLNSVLKPSPGSHNMPDTVFIYDSTEIVVQIQDKTTPIQLR